MWGSKPYYDYFLIWVFQTIEEVRSDCGVSRDGSKASKILSAARGYGFNASGGHKSLEEVRQAHFPVIIHWNFNHFVVLEGYKKGIYYLNDPASGPRTVDEATFNKAFTGITMEFIPGEDLNLRERNLILYQLSYPD